MLRTGLVRMIEIALTMLTVSVIVYLLLEFDSDDVAVKVLGQFSTAAQRTQWLHEHGYDQGFLVRYLAWLRSFLSGDWGRSLHYQVPVLPLVAERLVATAILGVLTLALMIPLGLGFGILAGIREGCAVDRVISIFSIVTTSVPEFASAVFLTGFFVFWLGLLPGASTMTSGFSWQEIVLPLLVLVLYGTGYLARVTRASVAEVMNAPYVRTARMKGAGPWRIVGRHVLRNALVAPATIIMLQIPWLLSGVIVVEVFFAYRGFGSLLYEAGLNSDINVIEACAMISVFVVVVTQLCSDLINTWLNPRTRRIRVTCAAPAPIVGSATPLSKSAESV
ncbi:MAG: ABC transporter permease [Methylorubrum populi]